MLKTIYGEQTPMKTHEQAMFVNRVKDEYRKIIQSFTDQNEVEKADTDDGGGQETGTRL